VNYVTIAGDASLWRPRGAARLLGWKWTRCLVLQNPPWACRRVRSLFLRA